MASSCFVCRKHQILESDLLVYADDSGVVTQIGGESGIYLGHLFVEPRRHFVGLDDATEGEATQLGRLLRLTCRALKSVGCEHVYVFVLGDAVPHLHFHVVGRYPDAPREYWGIRTNEWPEAPRGSRDEVARFTARVRGVFEYAPASSDS